MIAQEHCTKTIWRNGIVTISPNHDYYEIRWTDIYDKAQKPIKHREIDITEQFKIILDEDNNGFQYEGRPSINIFNKKSFD